MLAHGSGEGLTTLRQPCHLVTQIVKSEVVVAEPALSCLWRLPRCRRQETAETRREVEGEDLSTPPEVQRRTTAGATAGEASLAWLLEPAGSGIGPVRRVLETPLRSCLSSWGFLAQQTATRYSAKAMRLLRLWRNAL